MKSIKLLVLLMIFNTSHVAGIVIRHDVSDEQYFAKQSDFPPLATLYNIGTHGTLIHPEWVLTAAHVGFCMEPGRKIKIGDQIVPIAKRFNHHKYQLDQEHDIALIKLATPITGVEPAELYPNTDEKGMVTWFIGAGGTGTGDQGQTINYNENNGQLRKAKNKITDVTDTDIVFIFEKGDEGEPLEGVSGNGDSGGPAFIKKGDKYQLIGVSSRADSLIYDIGEYGVTERYARVSSYLDWISRVMSAKSDAEIADITTQNRFLQDDLKIHPIDKVCNYLEIK